MRRIAKAQIDFCGMLRIPMRGYEKEGPQNGNGGGSVTNPHEGL